MPKFTYEIDGNSIIITGVDAIPENGELIIPDEIDGYPVRGIGYKALQNHKDLVRVILPDVGDEEFTIDDLAFKDCESLVSINFPEECSLLGEYTFEGCSSLKVNSSGDQPVEIDPDDPDYKNVDGVIFSTENDELALVSYPSDRTDSSYTVPDGVEIIRPFAFSENNYLKSVNMPSSRCNIMDKAFWKCSNLTDIYVPDGNCFGLDGPNCVDPHTILHIPGGYEDCNGDAYYYLLGYNIDDSWD